MYSNQEMIVREKLIKLAKQKTFYDREQEGEDICLLDYGNADDCFGFGHRDGQIDLARDICQTLGYIYETDSLL